MKNKQAPTPFVSLVLEDDYEDFADFYGCNRIKIYNAILKLFQHFEKSSETVLELKIDAKITNIPWDTKFKFDVTTDVVVLKRDLLPFYVDSEYYEVASEILRLTKTLDNQNNKRLK